MNYNIENYRVGQKTDYEKLNINITTDGSIDPKLALTEASKILIQHFMLFSDEKINLESDTADDFDEDTYLTIELSASDIDSNDLFYNCDPIGANINCSVNQNNITFTFCGFSDEFQKIRDFLLANYFEKSTFIYKKSKDEQYILICKNQTCSQKLKNISEINNYLNERSI